MPVLYGIGVARQKMTFVGILIPKEKMMKEIKEKPILNKSEILPANFIRD